MKDLPVITMADARMDFGAPRDACVEILAWGADVVAVARVLRARLRISIAEVGAKKRITSATFDCILTWDAANALRDELTRAGATVKIHLEALE